jgi:hypothetical protein
MDSEPYWFRVVGDVKGVERCWPSAIGLAFGLTKLARSDLHDLQPSKKNLRTNSEPSFSRACWYCRYALTAGGHYAVRGRLCPLALPLGAEAPGPRGPGATPTPGTRARQGEHPGLSLSLSAEGRPGCGRGLPRRQCSAWLAGPGERPVRFALL